MTEEPGQEKVHDDSVAKIQKSVEMASSMSGDLLFSTVKVDQVLKQACYLPSTADGSPMMGELSDRPNTFVCTGHTCWGILMGPASGEAMANLIATGKSPHVNLSPFDPSRFGTLSMVPRTSKVV